MAEEEKELERRAVLVDAATLDEEVAAFKAEGWSVERHGPPQAGQQTLILTRPARYVDTRGG